MHAKMLHGAGDSVFRFHFFDVKRRVLISIFEILNRYTYFLKFAFGVAYL